MARYSRDDGLSFDAIWINDIPVRKSLLKSHWSKLARECYARKCNCEGCNLIPPLDSLDKCQVKYYVMAYIKLGYYPQEDEEENYEK